MKTLTVMYEILYLEWAALVAYYAMAASGTTTAIPITSKSLTDPSLHHRWQASFTLAIACSKGSPIKSNLTS